MNIVKFIKSIFNPYREPKDFECDSFNLHVLDYNDLQKKFREIHPGCLDKVHGFYHGRDIYVEWDYTRKDRWGNYLPRFETCGHELWHLIVGAFHK